LTFLKRKPLPALPIELEEQLEKIKVSLERQEYARTKRSAVLAGVPNEQDRTRIIWSALVNFVNLDPDDEIATFRFQAFTSLCCFRLDELAEDPMLDLRCFQDIDTEYSSTGRAVKDIFRSRVRALRKEIRMMLVWLARPNECPPVVRSYSLEFLLEHGSDSAIEFSIDPTDKFDDEGEHGVPLLYWKRVLGYRTVFTPAAKFILDKLEQYHDRALTVDEAMPLIVCKRSECGKLAVARRGTRDFCSDSCRSLYRQKAKRQEWAAYMRKYRSGLY